MISEGSHIKRKLNLKNEIINRIFTLFFIFLFFHANNLNAQIPSDFSGLQLWLKGDTGLILNGINVLEWQDQSGNGNHASQSDTATQPSFVSDSLNNSPFLRFDGDDILNSVTLPGIENSSLSIFAVASGEPMNNGYHVLIDAGPFASNGMWFSVSNESFMLYCNNATFSTGYGSVSKLAGFLPKIFGLIKDFGVNADLYLSGTLFASSNGAAFVNTFTNGQFCIGGDPTYPSGNWIGDIAEVIVYNRILDTIERQAVELYLMNKYAPPVSLDSVMKACSFPSIVRAGKNYFTSYLWQDNSTGDSLIVNLPGTFSVTVTDIFGRTSVDSIQVVQDTANYFVNLGNDTVLCSGQQLFINAGSERFSYLWSDATTSNTINISASGDYSVTVTDCNSNVSIDTINVTVNPLPYFSLGNDTTVCFNNQYILDPGFVVSSGFFFNWSDGSVDSVLAVIQSGSYSLAVSDAVGCAFFDTVSVIVDSSLYVVSLGQDTSLCSGNSISLVSGSGSVTQYLWPDNSTGNSLVLNTSGDYWVSVTNVNGCTYIDTVTVTIKGTAPVPDFSFNYTCLGSQTQFSDQSTFIGTDSIMFWQWNFGDTVTSNIPSPVHIYSDTGSYNVVLTTVSDSGCTSSINKPLIIYPVPVADFSYCICNAPFQVSFTNSGTGALNYQWNFGDGSTSNYTNPTYLYNDTGTYAVSLIATNLYGCTDIVTESIIISDNIANNNLPDNLPGLILWLSSDSGVVSSSGTVSSWSDLSNNGNSVTQITQSLQPEFISNVLNGFPCVRFNGNNLLEGSTVSGLNSSSLSVFIVSSGGVMPNSGYQVLFDIGPYTPGGTWLSKNSETFAFYSNNAVLNSTVGDLPSTGFNAKIFETVKKFGVETKTYLSGVFRTSSTNSAFTGNFTNGDIYLCGDPTYPTGNWSGDIFEVLMYDTALTDSQRIVVEEYLFNKYSSPVNLGCNKLVCGFPFTINAEKDYFTTYLWNDNSTSDSLVVYSPGTYSLTTTDVFGRISADTVIIDSDTNSYNVYLGNDTAFCLEQNFILNAGPEHLLYTWSDGSHLNYINIDSTGIYHVTVTDCNSDITTDTIQVTFNPLPVFDLGNDTTYCYNSQNIIDPGFVNSGNYTFLWSDGSTDSVLTVDHSSDYWLRVNNLNGCSFFDTIHIEMDSSLYNSSFGSDTISLCSGNIITLNPGNGQITDYLWNDNSTNPSLIINTTGDYWVSVTNINGCTATDTVHVNIQGIAPVPGYSYSDTCMGYPVVFTDTSYTLDGSTISAWQWIVNYDTLNTPNISVIFDTTDTFNVQLMISTTNNCSNTVSGNIIICPNPQALFSVEGTCEGGNSYFTNLSSTSAGYMSDWNWNFGDSSGSALYHSQHMYSGIGNYPVTLHVLNNFGCEDSLTTIVQIKLSPIAGFDFSPACTGNLTWFFDTSVVSPVFPIIDRYWDFGDGGTAIQQNPSHIYSAIGQFEVYMTVNSLNGCSSTILDTINVSARPVAGFIGDSACVGISLNFTDTSYSENGTINKWEWNFGNGITSLQKDPFVNYTIDGNYIVKLEVTSDVDCKDSTSKTVQVYSLPEIDFSVSPNIGPPGVQVITTNTSSSGQNFWSFGDGQTSQLLTPVHVFTDTGDYTVWLKVENIHGCYDSLSHSVKVVPRIYNLAIPEISTVENNEYILITANVANVGTMPVINPGLTLYSDKHTPLMEIYEDTIQSGQIINYSFNAQLPVSDKNMPKYICVKGSLSEGQTDEDLSDNEACDVLKENNFVLNLYPNPSSSDINLDLNIVIPGKSDIEIYDKAGRIIYKHELDLQAGFNRLIIDVKEYANGKYNIQLTVPEGSESLEFVKY